MQSVNKSLNPMCENRQTNHNKNRILGIMTCYCLSSLSHASETRRWKTALLILLITHSTTHEEKYLIADGETAQSYCFPTVEPCLLYTLFASTVVSSTKSFNVMACLLNFVMVKFCLLQPSTTFSVWMCLLVRLSITYGSHLLIWLFSLTVYF